MSEGGSKEQVALAAVDLGASSGRVMLGRLGPATLELTEIARFRNGGVRLPDGLYWDVLGLYLDILDGVRAADRRARSQGGRLAGCILLSPWRRERIFAYLNPWEEENALGKAYQLSHSLIAFGRGELFGVGLGGSVEKLHYLPEAHTDFLLAVIGEELGFSVVS